MCCDIFKRVGTIKRSHCKVEIGPTSRTPTNHSFQHSHQHYTLTNIDLPISVRSNHLYGHSKVKETIQRNKTNHPIYPSVRIFNDPSIINKDKSKEVYACPSTDSTIYIMYHTKIIRYNSNTLLTNPIST